MTHKPALLVTRPRSPACECLLRLYVSAAAPSSARAVVNTRAFFEKHMAGRYELEILSISEHVQDAAHDQVVAAPTLIRVWPLPVRRFIGDMSDPQRLVAELCLEQKRGDPVHE
jgi:circadian clock protein KaiB